MPPAGISLGGKPLEPVNIRHRWEHHRKMRIVDIDLGEDG
jgi:hypothetical protein